MRVAADGTLTIPDFAGNLFFATLGNILLNGKAGLVFADFETGDLLQMTGDAEVVLSSPEIAAFQGAERLWTFRPRRVVRRRGRAAAALDLPAGRLVAQRPDDRRLARGGRPAPGRRPARRAGARSG